MMTYGSVSAERKKYKSEVFTPPGIVFGMVLLHTDILENIKKTMFDPCVGEGQYPCGELVLKMFYNVDNLNEENALEILKSIYGMDIQADNVDKCRAHMLATLCDAYKFFTGEDLSKSTFDSAVPIIFQNFAVGDSLKFMKKLIEENDFKKLEE